MRLRALGYFYSRRLRMHAVQELLAGLGVAVAVALVFAVTVANSSIAGSAGAVVKAVIGRADLQLHARGPDGVDERLLTAVERLPGVKQAAPVLEQTASVVGPHGRRAAVTLAGTDVSLAILDGLAHTLPIGALAPGGLGLTQTTARDLQLPRFDPQRTPVKVSLRLRGEMHPVTVSAVLGRETAGALAQARIAVMPLERLQRLARLRGRVSRILVESKPHQETAVRRELERVAVGRLTVAPANADVSLLAQALRPSDQASALFAGLSALLGFLFAFNALLLTVPERREAIADLRLDGTSRPAIIQMVIFQALCLGVGASLIGLLGGLVLSTGVFHQSPGYLAKAFTLSSGTVLGVRPILLSVGGGLLATCLASAVPLQDLRRGRVLDSVFSQRGVDGALAGNIRRWLASASVTLILLASGLFLLVPSAAIAACVMLALATMIAVPLMLSIALRGAAVIAARNNNLTALPLALSSLKATAVRSLALAATGAVALFGSVALGSSRDDLLRGIEGFTAHYARSADVWIINPDDNQAINDFPTSSHISKIGRLPGIARTRAFQGSFLDFSNRRVWIIGWPADTPPELLNDQIVQGSPGVAATRLQDRGWVVISDQIAAEHHVGVGGTLILPTPAGNLPFRVAATATNFGWTPGAIVMSTRDYSRAWQSSTLSALGVDLTGARTAQSVRAAIQRELGNKSGLEVLTALQRETSIDKSANEGLGQLGAISTLLLLAAILAMAAALGSSLWQRRRVLAELRLEGASRGRLQLILLIESALMLSAGCLTGAIAGVYGQLVIDGYLARVAGFPVAGAASGLRPVEIFVVVVAAVLALVSLPAWYASRVPATLALEE